MMDGEFQVFFLLRMHQNVSLVWQFVVDAFIPLSWRIAVFNVIGAYLPVVVFWAPTF